jgi:hypothetical protein
VKDENPGRLAQLLIDHGVKPEVLLVEALAGLMWDAITEQDESEKMILHEPYRTIANAANAYLRGCE